MKKRIITNGIFGIFVLFFIMSFVNASIYSANLSDIYFTHAYQSPGTIYHYNTQTGNIDIAYQRNTQNESLSSFSLHKFPDEIFFVYHYSIYHAIKLNGVWQPEEIFYTHTTYVRDIAFGPDNALYFSEATGGGDNGTIYRLNGNTATVYYIVHLNDVDGFWAGNFAFNENGTLYLSSGNHIPARIYKVTDTGVEKIYQANHPIKGFVVKRNIIYYADWNKSIYALDLNTKTESVIYEHSIDGKPLSDVDVVIKSDPTSVPVINPIGVLILASIIGFIALRKYRKI